MYYWIMLGVFLYLLWAVQGAEEKIAKKAGVPVPFVGSVGSPIAASVEQSRRLVARFVCSIGFAVPD